MLNKKKALAVIAITALAGMMLSGSVPLARADTGPILPGINSGQTAVFSIGSKVVTVNGQAFTTDVAPYIDQNGRTQVPVRYLGDVLGMTAQWDQAKKQVTLTEQNFTAMEGLVIGSNTLLWVNETVDGSTTMDTVPVIVPPGRTMLPARYVAQALGCQVSWDPAARTVTVTPPGTSGTGTVRGSGGNGADGGVGSGSGVTPPYTRHDGHL